eukprot:INCI13077.1.p1 GENE.INCI13077.1~~INCI13077.1.p1  ORF type:complete len:484 (-),score=66.33 INCI13077.1:24-1475(-)
MSSVDQPHLAAVRTLQARIRAQAVRKEPRRAALNFHAAAAVLRFKAASLNRKGYAGPLGTNLTRKEKETTALLPEDTGRPMFMFGEAKHPQKVKGGDLAKRWEMGQYQEKGLEKRRIRHAIPEGRESYKKRIDPVKHREKQWGDVRARVGVPGKHMGYRSETEIPIEKEMQPRRSFPANTSLAGAGLSVKEGRYGTLEGSMARRRKFAKNGTQLTKNTPKSFMADASIYPSHFKKEQEQGLLMQQLRFSGGRAIFALSGAKGRYSAFNGLYVPQDGSTPGDRPFFRLQQDVQGFPVLLYYCKKNGGTPPIPSSGRQAASEKGGVPDATSEGEDVEADGNFNGAGGDTLDDETRRQGPVSGEDNTGNKPAVVKEFEGWIICMVRSESDLRAPGRHTRGMWLSSTGAGAETPMNVGRWQTWAKDGTSWEADKDIRAHFNAWPWALKENKSFAQKQRETEHERAVAEVEALLDYDEWDRVQAANAE